MRRNEFKTTDPALLKEVLTSARIAHLAFARDERIELLPFNFVLVKNAIELHCSPKAGLAAAAGQELTFLTYDAVGWIPSTWRHPELACPATTYYRSVSFRARLESVESIAEKATSLGAFMKKYQPDDPYTPLDDPMYHQPLKKLFVARLPLKAPVCKVKMGQHLSPRQRSSVHENLLARGGVADVRVAQAMRAANPDLVAGGSR